ELGADRASVQICELTAEVDAGAVGGGAEVGADESGNGPEAGGRVVYVGRARRRRLGWSRWRRCRRRRGRGRRRGGRLTLRRRGGWERSSGRPREDQTLNYSHDISFRTQRPSCDCKRYSSNGFLMRFLMR